MTMSRKMTHKGKTVYYGSITQDIVERLHRIVDKTESRNRIAGLRGVQGNTKSKKRIP
jgi:hypothetical protein